MWNDLKGLAEARDGRRIETLFAEDPARAETFSVTAEGMLFDYSKTQIDAEVMDSLLTVARRAEVERRRDMMFAGAKINETEGRAVLHTALRNLEARPVEVDGQDVMPGVLDTLARMEELAREIRGSDITDVVNIGIGGSDLGPKMGTLALAPWHDGPRCHFVSNVDGADIADVLKSCPAQTTLFVIASKTFTTIETMTNARTARSWLEGQGVSTEGRFVALSSNLAKAGEWGIPASRVFGFEDWVGGRYSMWGPIGLSMMIAVGPENFRAFLEGGEAMDSHFRRAPLEENMPALLALVGIWHNQGMGHGTRAVLPYENRLSRLPAYLQQLEMESNGKSVAMDGSDLPYNSGPVVWGEPGTNGQHAFYQLLHQGTSMVPCDLIGFAEPTDQSLVSEHHDLLTANMLAQAEALAFGRTAEEVAASGVAPSLVPHRTFPGNVPSTTILAPRLTPSVLGQLVALYEHKVAAQGFLWGINSFDQWGVELGKQLATTIASEIADGSDGDHDSSTTALLRRYRAMRGEL